MQPTDHTPDTPPASAPPALTAGPSPASPTQVLWTPPKHGLHTAPNKRQGTLSAWAGVKPPPPPDSPEYPPALVAAFLAAFTPVGYVSDDE